MSAIKHAFEKIGEGIKHIGEAIGHGLEGLGKVVGGVLTMHPSEIKSGFSDMGKGLKECVSGLGESVGGLGGAVIGATPLGAAVNALTGDKLSKFVEGIGTSAASVVNNGIDGVGQFAEGVATGNLGEAFKGALNVGQVALLAVPGAGEAELAGDVAAVAAKGLLKQGVETEALNG